MTEPTSSARPTSPARRRRTLLIATAGAVATAAAASVVIGTTVAGATPTATVHPVLTTRHTSLGTVLVTRTGHTLYLFTPDRPTKSACTGACAASWPAYTVKPGTRITVGGGARSARITTIKHGSTRQLVYGGHPLYAFSGDSAAGQTNGEGVDGTWYALSVAGKAVHATVSGASSSAPADPGSSAAWG